MTRTTRLSERFKNIEQAVSMTVGPRMAFAASCVAKLEGIQYACLQALRRVQAEQLDSENPSQSIVPAMHQEIKDLLMSFHSQLCDHLCIEQSEAIKQSAAFKEIVDDICNQRG